MTPCVPTRAATGGASRVLRTDRSSGLSPKLERRGAESTALLGAAGRYNHDGIYRCQLTIGSHGELRYEQAADHCNAFSCRTGAVKYKRYYMVCKFIFQY